MIDVKKSTLLLSVALTAVLCVSGCGIDNTDANIVGENLIIDAETFKPEVDLAKEVIQAGLDAQGQGQADLLPQPDGAGGYLASTQEGFHGDGLHPCLCRC